MTAASGELTREGSEARLPAWRLIAALVILGGMALTLLSLAPVYLKDWQLRNYMRELAARPDVVSMTDDTLRNTIVGRAWSMGLPMSAPDVQVKREAGKVKLEIRYTVHFQLYQVDLHFHTSAVSH